jgi:predicted phosphohydrolase
MSRVFALGDLHLSLAGTKPMDVFGAVWHDHAGRMAAAWDACVTAEDTVLLAGDLSWARSAAEAAPDLAWIAGRPGRKVLLRGNHDSWWKSPTAVRRILPPGCELLQNDAHRAGEWIVVGARGWTPPGGGEPPHDRALFERELERLRLSIAHADREFGRGAPRLALLHFPPRIEGAEPSAVVPLLREGGVRLAVYGHLHGDDHRLAVQGERDGIAYRFVAADAVGFAPVLLPTPGEIGSACAR